MKAVYSRLRSTLSTRLVWLALALVFVIGAQAQTESAQVSGTVRDQTGAVIAGAKVTIKSVNTGTTRDVVTNASGIYTASGLKPDTYDVTIQQPGFEKLVKRVQLAVGSTNDVSAQLQVGATATTVEVAAAAESVTVNTESQTLSEVITAQQLADLPTSPTRNPYSLVASSGNVTEDSNSGRGAGFSINGARSSSTSILLDGAENVDAFTADVGQVVPLDSMQEFRDRKSVV